LLGAELAHSLRAVIQQIPTYTADLQPLRADLAPRFFGAGGPRMAEAGVDLAFDLTRHSVVGLSDPLKKAFRFKSLFNELLKLAIAREPDAIVCIDFSEFNRLFAAAVRKYVRARHATFNNWNPKIIKYVSPQVWASRAGRARQIARDFDLLLSLFPFEKDWYAARVPQLSVEFIGHPMIDRYASFIPDSILRTARATSPLILLLPGSRTAELSRHLPPMLGALEIVRSAIPTLRARMVLPNEMLVDQARRIGVPSSLELRSGGLAESLSQAELAIASTGTVTMECAFFGVPTVTLYKTSWSTYQIGKRLIKIKSLTMPNVLAGEEVFPEFIQDAATPENISRAAIELLRFASRLEKLQAKLGEIVASLGGPGASRRAAEAIVKILPM
jgi:lipid-A-disaccharide synthase